MSDHSGAGKKKSRGKDKAGKADRSGETTHKSKVAKKVPSQGAPSGAKKVEVAFTGPSGATKPTAVDKAASQGPLEPELMAEVGDAGLARRSAPIRKALYKEHEETAAMTEAEVTRFREERCITSVHGSDLKPVRAFKHLGLKKKLLHAVRDFQMPSPIQAQCWPIALSGCDLIGIAATGSGKTLAFGLPALHHVCEQRRRGVATGRGPGCLCIAPTRELAQQICSVLQDAGSVCGVTAVCVYGGVPKRAQAAELRGGAGIVVGTPGRMRDLMEDGTLDLSEVTYVVLDEADRMLDLGFEPEIRHIVGCTRADRQTVMFSATWPQEVQRLAAAFLSRPVHVTIGSRDLAASHSVAQTVEVLEDGARESRLAALLSKHHASRQNRIIIFVLYKKEAPRVESFLRSRGFKAVAVHGDVAQAARNQAVEQFKRGEVPLLIATDVAARGLDIPDVEMVINFSFPLTVEDYVHRIGRTGRAGKTGCAHTFFVGKNDKAKAGELVNVLREAKQSVPKELLAFGGAVKRKESKLYGVHFKDVDLSKKAKKVKFDSDDD